MESNPWRQTPGVRQRRSSIVVTDRPMHQQMLHRVSGETWLHADALTIFIQPCGDRAFDNFLLAEEFTGGELTFQ